MRIAYAASIHPDFDARFWKYATSIARSGCKVHLVCPWRIPAGEVHDGVIFHTFDRVEKRVHRPLLIPARLLRILLPLLKEAGALFYPHPANGQLMPTTRLEAMRRGFQDYQYLILLNQARGQGRIDPGTYNSMRQWVEALTRGGLRGRYPTSKHVRIRRIALPDR